MVFDRHGSASVRVPLAAAYGGRTASMTVPGRGAVVLAILWAKEPTVANG